METNKIIIEVNEDCSDGSWDCTETGIYSSQIMYAACMLIDILLKDEVYTLDEVLDIVRNIPNADVSDTSSHLWN